MPANVRLEEVIDAANRANRAGLHTCLPGVVKSFDPLTTTITVQPTIKNPVFDVETGERDTPEDPPVIPNVPVVYPRGGGYHMSFPLQPGDHVVLVFSELSTAQWRTTGAVSEPGDVRRHSLGYPFAIPGAFPVAGVLVPQTPSAPLTAGKLALGLENNPAMNIRISSTSVECGGLVPVAVALGPAVFAALTAITTYIAALTANLAAQPVTYSAFAPLMAAPGATVAGIMATQLPLVQATITKGQ